MVEVEDRQTGTICSVLCLLQPDRGEGVRSCWLYGLSVSNLSLIGTKWHAAKMNQSILAVCHLSLRLPNLPTYPPVCPLTVRHSLFGHSVPFHGFRVVFFLFFSPFCCFWRIAHRDFTLWSGYYNLIQRIYFLTGSTNRPGTAVLRWRVWPVSF